MMNVFASAWLTTNKSNYSTTSEFRFAQSDYIVGSDAVECDSGREVTGTEKGVYFLFFYIH